MMSGIQVTVNSPDLAKFYKNLRNIDKTLAKELRAELRGITKPIVTDVRNNALTLPSNGEGREGVSLRAGLAAATEARTRALNNGMLIRIRISGTKFAKVTGKYRKLPRYVEGYGRRSWRHPVFADKGVRNGQWTGAWVEQRPTPFLIETVLRHKDTARRAVLKAFDDAVVRHGFR